MKIDSIPDEQVVVKIASCSKCKGWVTIATKHMMTLKDKNLMAREAIKYNHNISEMSLLEFRSTELPYCKCNIS